MANTGLKGRVVFAGTNNGIKGVTVSAYDIDPLSADDHLGTTVSDDQGLFAVSYRPDQYRAWFVDRNPDIEVRFYGPVQRLLLQTPMHEDVTVDILDLGTIEIHQNNFPVPASASALEKKNDPSWLVTHTSLDPASGDPVRLTQGNQVEWLVDGAAMFPAVTDAIENATQSVKFLNMFFKVGHLFTRFDFSPSQDPAHLSNGDTVKVTRLEKILTKLANDKNIPVDVLVWDLSDIFLFDAVDTADEVKAFFEGSKVLTDVLMTTQLLHIKLAVIDGETAFVIGSTMSQGYFSDERHLIHDARHRGSLIHDVSSRLKGPAVRFIDQTFSTIWNAGPTPAPVKPAPQTAPLPNGASLQVLRTLPGELFASPTPDADTEDLPHGETGILEAYQRAIANAEDYIYIEDQYFTSPEIVNAIQQRMSQAPGLEVILILNIKPDIFGYPQKQAALINELRRALGAQADRLGVFTLWSSDASRVPFEINNIYVHSKLAIIDDKWATVGSANLDGASLNFRQWELILKGFWEDLPLWAKLLTPLIPVVILLTLPAALPRLWPFLISALRKETTTASQHVNPHQDRQPPRHPELNLVLYNDIAGQPGTARIAELRVQLWTEHLGAPPPATRPSGGWLSHWRSVAAAHLASLKSASASQAKILEWKPDTDPEKNLRALGVQTAKMKVGEYDEAGTVNFIPQE